MFLRQYLRWAMTLAATGSNKSCGPAVLLVGISPYGVNPILHRSYLEVEWDDSNRRACFSGELKPPTRSKYALFIFVSYASPHVWKTHKGHQSLIFASPSHVGDAWLSKDTFELRAQNHWPKFENIPVYPLHNIQSPIPPEIGSINPP